MENPVQILVLEDDQELREMLAEVLEDEGFSVETASHGEEAVEKAHRQPFDLVVADIRMDGIDGLEALSQVRSQRPDVGSLVVTGYADEADTERAGRLGLGGCLKKPFSAEVFLEEVRKVLAERKFRLRRSRWGREVRETARWALNNLAAAAGLEKVARMADGVSREMHLNGLQAEAVRAVCLSRALKQQGKFQPGGLPETLAAIDGQLESRWDEKGRETPLEARIAAVVLAACSQEWEEESELSIQLESKWSGRFDPSVLKALDGYLQVSDLEAPQPAGVGRRGLLSLARALEQLGDSVNAERAYQEILESALISREGIDASLGLARIWAGQGEIEKARMSAIRAPELGRQLGGASAGHAALEAGLLLAELEALEPSRQLLTEAEEILTEIRIPVAAARARLARRRLLGESLEAEDKNGLQVLFAPEYGAELAASAHWLLPLLLESQAQGSELPLDRASVRLVRQFPSEMQRLLSLGGLSTRARLVAVKVAHGTNSEAFLKTLLLDPDNEVREQARAALSKLGASLPETPLLRIYSFDRLEYFLGEERLEKRAWRTNKTQIVMARIAAACGAVVQEDILLETFWPGNPEKARRNLYTCLSNMRRALRSDDGDKDAPSYVMRDGPGIRLHPDLPRWHDYEEFLKAHRQGDELWDQGQRGEAASLFRRACELYRGPYLEGEFADWAVRIKDQTERAALKCHVSLAQLGNEQRDYKEALEHAQAALEIDSCLQEGYLLAMNAQLGLGRHEQVARLYQKCKKILRKELDMEPSIDIERTHQRALMGVGQETIG